METAFRSPALLHNIIQISTDVYPSRDYSQRVCTQSATESGVRRARLPVTITKSLVLIYTPQKRNSLPSAWRKGGQGQGKQTFRFYFFEAGSL